MARFTQADLEAYLDDALPVDAAAAIEQAVRDDATLRARLATILARRNTGVHSLGEIWRRERLGCPTRQQLGSYLLAALSPEAAVYVRQHVELVGCRYCQANLADLDHQQREATAVVETRRKRIFESSAGLLRAAGARTS